MTIRDATEADLPAVIDIYNATVPTRIVTAELEPVSMESRLPWFREHSPEHHPFWVIETDQAIAAWLSFHEFITRSAYRGAAEISVYVHEAFRRRGLARRLLEEAIARSPTLGIHSLIGWIFAHNEPSLQLFAQLGFERWGLLPRVARLDDVERDLVIVGLHVPTLE
jgi:L-amino acid N-acyltransferase YncA